jgi:hypothetical protein
MMALNFQKITPKLITISPRKNRNRLHRKRKVIAFVQGTKYHLMSHASSVKKLSSAGTNAVI